MGRQEQLSVDEIINGNVIAYRSGLAPVFGVNAALLLSQLLYWHGKGSRNDGWFYKTQLEMQDETGLTRTQQENAIKRLKKHGVISTARKGIPAKRHYRVHMRKLRTCLRDFYKLDTRKKKNHKPRKKRTITENTAQITQEITALQRNNRVSFSETDVLKGVPSDGYINLDDIPF